MLLAEGFQVILQPTKVPMTLVVTVDGKLIWSYALWRRQIPDQKKLAQMVRATTLL